MTTLRLALAGTRVDLLRIALTMLVSALTTLAVLAAITVALIGPGDGPYTSSLLNEPGLHPGVVIAFLGLCIPTLVLLAQCSRIGAPARDHRLSAIRMAGAAPRDVTRLVVAESGLATLLGSGGGVGLYFAGRALLGTQRVTGSFTPLQTPEASDLDVPYALRFPTDVVVPWWACLAVALGVPAIVAVASGWALRRVAFTPFGTVRRTRVRTPRVAPLVLMIVGVAMFFALAALLDTTFGQALGSVPFIALVFLAFLFIVAGLLSGQGALTLLVGRRLASRTSSPALLLAARRMTTDPFAGTRSTAVLVVAVVIAAGAQRLRDITLADLDGGDQARFFTNAYDLVDLVLVLVAMLAACGLLVAGAEGIVARRRTYAAVVAAGTPRSVVAVAVLAELLLPLVPGVLLAVVTGTAAGIGFYGWNAQVGTDTVFVDLSWGSLLAIVAGAIVITAAVTSVSLVFLRRATDIGELRRAA